VRNTNRSDALSTRRFGTTDLAIVLALWSAMAVLVGGVMSELASDSETPMAKAQSEAYAHQLASASGESGEKDGPSLRGPASVAASLPADPSASIWKVGTRPLGKTLQLPDREFGGDCVVGWAKSGARFRKST
jgi:hypothetical protein